MRQDTALRVGIRRSGLLLRIDSIVYIMASIAFLKRWSTPQRKQKKSNPQNEQDPPTYFEVVYGQYKIKATDTPRWKWTQPQCRAWLVATLTTSLGNSEMEALRKAETFVGSGPYMWNLHCFQWEGRLGEAEGSTVYNVLLASRRKRGAVPKGVDFPHWRNE